MGDRCYFHDRSDISMSKWYESTSDVARLKGCWNDHVLGECFAMHVCITKLAASAARYVIAANVFVDVEERPHAGMMVYPSFISAMPANQKPFNRISLFLLLVATT